MAVVVVVALALPMLINARARDARGDSHVFKWRAVKLKVCLRLYCSFESVEKGAIE